MALHISGSRNLRFAMHEATKRRNGHSKAETMRQEQEVDSMHQFDRCRAGAFSRAA
jgi:hypothetical protein